MKLGIFMESQTEIFKENGSWWRNYGEEPNFGPGNWRVSMLFDGKSQKLDRLRLKR